MSDPLFVRIAYEWGNPYRQPPEGQPKVMLEVFRDYKVFQKDKSVPEIDSVWKPGSGYSVTYTFLHEPPKQMDQSKLASIRMKRLRRRIEKKYPLFADQIVSEEVAANPDFYKGITDPALQAGHDQVVKAEVARLEQIRASLR